MTTIKYKQESSEDITRKVFSYAEKREKASVNKLKIHFWRSQHFDSEFEKRSGKLQLGFLAKDPQVALVMMLILQYGENFQEWLELEEVSEEITVEAAVEKLGDLSDSYRMSFDIGDIYKTTYYHRTEIDGKLEYVDKKIETTFQEVEIYNLQRIKEDYVA